MSQPPFIPACTPPPPPRVTCLITPRSAPDTPRCNARPQDPAAPLASPFRHESAAVLRKKSGQPSPCPGATPTSRSSQHTMENADTTPTSTTQHAAKRFTKHRERTPYMTRRNTPVFILPRLRRRSRSASEQRGRFACFARTQRLVPRREVSPGPAYTQRRENPPDEIHRYSLVTGFTRRPVESARPQLRHHVHFLKSIFAPFVFFPPLPFFSSSGVHRQALPAQP